MAGKLRNDGRRVPMTKTGDFTKESALAYLRKHPDVAPELPAMHMMRTVESWDEHRAVIAALDELLAEDS